MGLVRKGDGPLNNEGLIVAALRASRWIVSIAARDLGVSREALYKALRRHGIERHPPSRKAMSEILRAAGARGGRSRTRSAA